MQQYGKALHQKLHNEIYCLVKISQQVFKMLNTRVIAQSKPVKERMMHPLEDSWNHVNFVRGNNHVIFSLIYRLLVHCPQKKKSSDLRFDKSLSHRSSTSDASWGIWGIQEVTDCDSKMCWDFLILTTRLLRNSLRHIS